MRLLFKRHSLGKGDHQRGVESTTAITNIYVPLVKKAMSEYALENGLTEYKGRSLCEISEKIKSIFEIEIPIPILHKILKYISDEINDDSIFALYSDGSFIIKSYVFQSIDSIIEQESANIEMLKQDYKSFCSINEYEYNFEELKQFIFSQQIELFTDKRVDLIKTDYSIPKYLSDRLNNDAIFKIISNIFLGSIIASYFELNITKKVTDSELLIDTNFFISLIDLNTEDAHHTCCQLFSLCKQLGYRFTILDSTVKQIQVLLSNRINDFANRDFIGSVRCADVFNACVRRNIDKTGLERIKDNIKKLLEKYGIVIIYDVQIKEIIEKAKRSKEYNELFQKRKNKDSALNDTVARFYVESKRGQNPREFVDVKCWFLHNSYSQYDNSYERKLYERYLISANELLILLWLSSPSQGQQIKISDVTKGGLASYITKYRRAKMPTHDALKMIKKRVDDVMSNGLITEKDTFNLCIRMAEGHLTQEQVEESLISNGFTNEQFAAKLKEYTNEVESCEKKHKQEADARIDDLTKRIEEKDNQIKNLSKRLESIEKSNYINERAAYVAKKRVKVKRDTWITIFFAVFICALWGINEFYKNYLQTWLAILIAVLLFVFTTFGVLFIDQTKVRDYFCRKQLTKRLEDEYDNMHSIKSSNEQ